MGFWTLFEAASMPITQVLIISLLGALMATDKWNLLHADARKSLNKIVFIVFTPSLMFASLAKTVTLQDIISWWFMPINIGITFLVGGTLGWIVVKIMKPKPYLEGLIIASCSAGNLGNLLLIVVPAICNEDGSPFGSGETCRTLGLSYASFSMALGGFYIWTYTYHLIRTSGVKFRELGEAQNEFSKEPNKDFEATQETHLLEGKEQVDIVVASTESIVVEDTESQNIVRKASNREHGDQNVSFSTKLLRVLHQVVEEVLAPPTVAAILGFTFGATTFLRNLIIGNNAPLRVVLVQDSVKLLGFVRLRTIFPFKFITVCRDGTIPCITLILGGNLTQGLRKSRLKFWTIVSVICVRYMILPAIGIFVVKAAGNLGFLPADPLFHFVLLIQYTLPPAMNIGTITQLFDVGQEECSVLFLWTYLVAALALTMWSTVFMGMLS